MKKNIKIIGIVLVTLAILVSSLATVMVSAAPTFDYDGYGDYGQRIFDLNSSLNDSKIKIDGIVEDGEYENDPIVLNQTSDSLYWADWSTELLFEEDVETVLPQRISYYVDYDKKGLYVAAEIIERTPYTICPNDPLSLWGLDSLEIDVCIDAGRRIPENTFTQQNMMDRIRTTFALTKLGDEPAKPMGFCYTASSYGKFVKDAPMETFDIKRNEDTSTTTYEVFYAWDDLWNGGVPPQVFINFQLHIADAEFLDAVDTANGYVACIGALRYACKLPDEVKDEDGLSSAIIYHMFNLVDRPTEETSETTETSATTSEETSTATETTTVTTTTAESTAGTSVETTTTVAGSTTTEASEEKGCGSSLTVGASITVASVCFAAITVKKKKRD